MQETDKFDFSQICFESDAMKILSIVGSNERHFNFPLRQGPINFSILRSDGRFSNRWGVKTEVKGDVYIYCRDVPDSEKISLHASGRQHISITSETATRVDLDNRFGPVWSEPKFAQTVIATFSFLFPPWGVGIPWESSKYKKRSSVVVGHKEKTVVVAFFIVESSVNLNVNFPHVVIGQIPLSTGKTVHVIAWKEPQEDLKDLVQKVFPHVSQSFFESATSEDDYTLNLFGFRESNSAFMVSVPVHYKPPVKTRS